MTSCLVPDRIGFFLGIKIIGVSLLPAEEAANATDYACLAGVDRMNTSSARPIVFVIFLNN